MNDITALAQGKSLRKKLNRRMNDALGFRRTSGGKHNTICLSIDECKSVIAALDERLALVEALEAAKKRIAELEALARGVKQFSEFQICHYGATEDYAKGYIDCQNNYNKALAAAGIGVKG